ncbi:hypothetical protein TeGR_g15197 [Tetraparma gracilis]|uniref:Amino acid transporter transmembrane domain-containing protein n=1 Tax=Tetraparma gracilis TaxID=2962635 RepID=A0ABQ6ML27_9STRA|nr:hypothetical protein TeGR_g15197 [Tetraparma gracilis]
MDNGAAAESLLPTSSSTAPTQPVSFLPGSMFNLANSIIGAGALTLPYALHQTGLLLGLLLLLLFATLSACSLLMLDRSCRLTSATSFASLGAAAFPSRAKAITRIIDLTQSLYSFGACVGYLSICVAELKIITGISATLPLLGCCIVVVYPLSLLRSMKALSFTSLLAIVCVGYLSLILAIRFPWEGGVCSSGSGAVESYKMSEGLFTSLPIFCFAFNCQVQFIPIKQELHDPSPSRVRLLVLAVMAGVCLLYAADASLGYASYCADTLSNILDNFASGDKLVLVARVAFVLVLNFSFPLYSTAIVSSVDSMIGGEGVGKKRRRVTLATLIIGAMALIVSFDPPLDKILGLTGAVGGCALVYVFPGTIYDRALRAQKGGGEGGSWVGLLLAAAGAVLGITCTSVILYY